MKEYVYRIFTSISLLVIIFFSYNYNQFFFTILTTIFLLSYYEFSKLILKIKKLSDKKFAILLLGLVYLSLVFNYIQFTLIV